ncbi:hypothetical protein OG311_36745 [Streptomyces sp. NBC_01343]|uniref:hypothetical protein n=1 Tax=Streptomyces sp. NBC_01343 TaxID=2903832 RepID=UPI002E150C3E|nr:hypothetical protein OG311_36745 [Streptomyces sp. NBC_01343]
MKIPLAWLEQECGGPVDRAALLDHLHESGARAGLHADRLVEVLPPPELAHLGSVRGLAAEVRARNAAGPTAPQRSAPQRSAPQRSAPQRSAPQRSAPLPDGLVLAAEDGLPGRVAAAVVRLPGEVRLPGAAADRLRAAGVPLTGTVADLAAYVGLETGQPLGAADAGELGLTGLRLRSAGPADPADPAGPPPGGLLLRAGERTVAVLGRDTPAAAVPADGRDTLVWAWWLDPAAAHPAPGPGPCPDPDGPPAVRGHDPRSCDRAVARLVALVTDWAGGTVTAAGGAGASAPAPRVLRPDPGELRRLVDPDLDLATLAALLAAGGAVVAPPEEGRPLHVTVPAARPDLDGVPALAGRPPGSAATRRCCAGCRPPPPARGRTGRACCAAASPRPP